MKTNFEKIDGRWVVPTGKVVAAGYINMGCDFDAILAEQCKDICTGETFAKMYDEETSEIVDEPVYHLVKHFEEMPEYRCVRKNFKKQRRASRIYMFGGIHWTTKLQIARTGKNRKFGRRMYPNQTQLKEFKEYLPF